MPDTEVIADLPGARLIKFVGGDGNEIAFDRKAPSEISGGLDPHKFRFGGYGTEKGAVQGIVSFDLLTGDPAHPKRWEKIFLKSFFDDHSQAPPHTPCLEIFMQDPGEGSVEDATMRRRIRISAFSGIECFLPLKAHGGVEGPNGSPVGAVGNTVFRLMQNSKRLVMNFQDDREDPVIYDTHGTSDENKWTPVARVVLAPV